MAGYVLVHEQVHVLQRRQPALFEGLYKERWGFLHPAHIDGHPWLDEHQILNPDAPDLRWVFPIRHGDEVRYIWPRVVFGETADAPRFPRDMWSVAVAVEPAGDGFRVKVGQDGKPVVEDLAAVTEYAAALAPSSYTFHPNEASADIFCAVLLFDESAPDDRLTTQYATPNAGDLAPYRDWFRAHLKQPDARRPSALPPP